MDQVAAPTLTLPETEARALRAGYEGAAAILEYGAGGSTAMAAEMPGKTVFSVEGDKAFIADLRRRFDAHPPAATVHLHHGDIGPTARWGQPADEAGHWRRFHRYPSSVWDRDDFVHPDVVLVDGRFRAACFLTTLFRITRPVRLFFDDYAERPTYHEVERYGAPVAMHGRMAEFALDPTPIPAGDLTWILETFTRRK
ncbi:hypothetical protein [Limimaricola hongkongensis]|uniref:Class I SAM-dependent methyltransferase n=1 Tax=Limimaricola hongkongensis DSM 17492 TaxID=1122180 RepID=A0A017HHR3_9RHOB|nr:hypothetical protein [Limimaricola hongkongensis]EYD73688.1 hypothetical protein Lokhon_00243 [Limimaricola hongkongensis DSM 17492]